jgi:uncharacterized damage-inducible protein DinB
MSSHRSVLAITLLSLFAGGAGADEEAFRQSLASNLRSVGDKLVALAEATDAEKFSWRPTPEVRSISQVYIHVIGSNLQLPARLGAEAPPGLEIPDSGPYALGVQRAHWEATVTEKDEVVGMLRDSFDYAIAAMAVIEDLEEEVAPYGFKDTKRNYLMLILAHANEHLGQSIAYARMAGIVPPWSRTEAAATPDSTAIFAGGKARGSVLGIDRFGNIQTSFVAADLDQLELQVGDHLALTAEGRPHVEVFIGTAFSDVQLGEWVAFLSQTGQLIVGRNYGSAASTLDLTAGETVTIEIAGSAHDDHL